jgi:hypothetical protein
MERRGFVRPEAVIAELKEIETRTKRLRLALESQSGCLHEKSVSVATFTTDPGLRMCTDCGTEFSVSEEPDGPGTRKEE